MKHFLFVATFLFAGFAVAQYKSKRPFLFNECGLNLSYSLPYSTKNNLESKFGFGFAANHSYRIDKRLNPILGADYQCVRFGAKELQDGSNLRDVNSQYHLLRVLFSVRIFPGKNKKIFLEPGLFGSVPIKNSFSARATVYESGLLVEKEINDRFSSTPGAGISFGLGCRIPVKKGNVLIKADGCWGVGSVLLSNGKPNASKIFYNPGMKFGLVYQLIPSQNRLF